jgi:hypothetical protein
VGIGSAPTPSQPLGVSSVLQRTLNLLGPNVGRFVVVGLAVVLPTYAVAVAGAIALGGSEDHVYRAGTLLTLVAAILSVVVVNVAATDTALAARDGRETSVRGMLTAIGRWFLPAFGLSLVDALGVGAGIFLCILPGVWLLVRWALALPALMAEESGIGGALRRSGELVQNRWWLICGLYLVSFVPVLVANTVMNRVVIAAARAATSAHSVAVLVATSVADVLMLSVLGPFAAIFVALTYLDARQVGPITAPARPQAPVVGPGPYPSPDVYPPPPPAPTPRPVVPPPEGGFAPPEGGAPPPESDAFPPPPERPPAAG